MLNVRKIASVMMAAVMILACLAGCSQPADNSELLAQLQQEISDLRGQVEALQQRVTVLETGAVADWSLTGTPLTQGSGAAVTLSVTPTAYQEGQLAMFRVLLEGQTVAELYCDWDGSAYTASVELDAADGYSYYVILTEPTGAQDHLELNSPEKPVDPLLVYMYSSLTATCMLNVFEWQIEGGTLSLNAGSAEVQLPRLTATGEAASCTGAALVLQFNGQEVERSSLTLPQETGDSLIMDIGGVTFAIPELEEGGQLDLWLEVVLSDGQVLTHSGSSWYYADGELIQAVG